MEPIVSVKNGDLRGKTAKDYEGKTYYNFQGIPYAKPPVGSLKFKAPVPADSWPEIRDATQNGNDCLSQGSRGSENCLFLNVYTPQLYSKNAVLKPVMFWIHGGGYRDGSGSSLMHGPQFLITKDVVVVTINYRFGLLGFLALEDPSVEVYGNAGLKDQIMALRWVQENIKQFCGDPNNVTIFGGSAGAACVHCLILSSSAKGLFHKAILQSGCAFCFWSLGQSLSLLIKQNLKLPATATDKELLTILQNMPHGELLNLQKQLPFGGDPNCRGTIGPVIENAASPNPVINQRPEDIIASGNYNHVPFIIGYNSIDGAIVEVFSKDFGQSGYAIQNFESKIPHSLNITKGSVLSKKITDEVKKFYYGLEKPSKLNRNQYYMMYTDLGFLWPLSLTVGFHLATTKQPIYVYKLSVESNLNIFKTLWKIDNPGAVHADETTYLFARAKSPKIIPNSVEDISVRRIVTLWTNFAKTGNPNSIKKDELIRVCWKPVENENLHYLNIGENLTVGVNPDHHRVEFWNSILLMSKCKL